MKEIEVELLGDGSKENPYRPNLPPQYHRYIDDTKTLENVDTKSGKIKVYFTREVKNGNQAAKN